MLLGMKMTLLHASSPPIASPHYFTWAHTQMCTHMCIHEIHFIFKWYFLQMQHTHTQTQHQLNHLNTHLRHLTLKCKHSHWSDCKKKIKILKHTLSYIHLWTLGSCWVSQWVRWSVIITEGLMEGSWMFSACCRAIPAWFILPAAILTHTHTHVLCAILSANTSIPPTLPSPQWLERDCPFSSGRWEEKRQQLDIPQRENSIAR